VTAIVGIRCKDGVVIGADSSATFGDGGGNWSDYTRLAKHIAAAAVFGSSAHRAAKLVALPADLIPRFDAAQDPTELATDTAQSL
jgi:ATP-dependent protease HslVU (ClpYQ) peptidase subunit